MKIAVLVAALIAGLGLVLPPDRELRPAAAADRAVGALAPTQLPAPVADTGRQSPDSQGGAPAPFP
ncbi:MAG: hypothetical protein JNJ80_23565 [Gemmatimonadetes bacterium]|nr:hypothetical protein [Gemmatimonadota bacterium]